MVTTVGFVLCFYKEMGGWFFYSSLKILLFIYFGLCWVFIDARAFSSCGKWGLLSSCGAWASHCGGFSGCGARFLGCVSFRNCSSWAQQLRLMAPRARAQQLWCSGLAAPRHVGSSRSRDRTCVSWIGRQILSHWTTRQVQFFYSFKLESKGEWWRLKMRERGEIGG